MSGRSRVTLPDGRTVTGFRKTLRRNPRAFDPLADADPAVPFELRVVLPRHAAVSEGASGVVGVSVERQATDLVAVATGHGLEWVFRQAAEFLGRLRPGTDEQMRFTVTRGRFRAGGELIYVPGPSVIVPRATRKTLVLAIRT